MPSPRVETITSIRTWLIIPLSSGRIPVGTGCILSNRIRSRFPILMVPHQVLGIFPYTGGIGAGYSRTSHGSDHEDAYVDDIATIGGWFFVLLFTAKRPKSSPGLKSKHL